MQTFTYPVLYKLLYRFGNIPVTLLLSLYLIPVVISLDDNIYYLIPFIITVLLIYFINKHYITLYKIVPYKIQADEEKMICSEFLFSEKNFTIYYTDIDLLTGGIFDGKFRGVMKVNDGKNKVTIGFYQSIRNCKELETLILSKVKKEVYDAVVERITKRRGKR